MLSKSSPKTHRPFDFRFILSGAPRNPNTPAAGLLGKMITTTLPFILRPLLFRLQLAIYFWPIQARAASIAREDGR